MRFFCWLFIICLVSPVQSYAWFTTIGGGGVAASAAGVYFSDDFSTDTIGTDWTSTTGSQSIYLGFCELDAAGLLTYTADTLDTSSGRIRYQMYNNQQYMGVAFRSTNDTSGYMYVARTYNNGAAWRYCSDNTTSCTDIESTSITTAAAGEYIQVEWSGTGNDTVVDWYNLGSSPAAFPDTTGYSEYHQFTNNPPTTCGAGSDLCGDNTGKYVALYNGASSNPRFDFFEAEDQ